MEFVDQTKTLVGALGWDLFRIVRGGVSAVVANDEPSADEPLRFSFRGEGFAADMNIDSSGDCVVLKDSKARVRTTPTLPKGTIALRSILIEKGVLLSEGCCLKFTSDYSFSSPSAAAATVMGASATPGALCGSYLTGGPTPDWEAEQNERMRPVSAPE